MIGSKRTFHTAARLLCALMACVLLLSSAPLPGAATEPVSYGRVKIDKVLFRKKINESDYWSRLNTGWVLKIEDTQTVGTEIWYKLSGNTPEHMTRNYTGYIKSDFFTPMTAAEQAAWLLNPVQPGEGATTTATATPQPSTTVMSGYAITLIAGANVRQTADPAGTPLTALAKDVLVTVISTGTDWHRVTSGAYTGYIQATAVKLLTDAEYKALTSGASTPVPQGTRMGTVQITKANTNLRNAPAGSSMAQIAKHTQLGYYAYPERKNGYDWLYVYDDATKTYGYIRGDCYSFVGGTPAPTQPPTPTPVPTLVPTATPKTALGYATVTKANTNLRDTPSGSSLAQIAKNQQVPYYAYPTTAGGYNWLYVYDSVSQRFGYIRSDCYAYVGASPAPTAPPASATSTVAPVTSGYVKLIKGGVNMRDAADGDTIAQLSRGTILPYVTTASAGGYLWYRVSSTQYGYGYIRSDMLVLCDAAGNTLAPGATPPPSSGATTPPATGDTVYGYVRTTKSSVNLRAEPRSGVQIYTQLPRNVVYPIIGATVLGSSYSWFYVRADGYAGYLRSDCVHQLTDAEVQQYLAGTGGTTPVATLPPTGTQPSSYIQTTLNSVNLRKSASKDSSALFNVKKGTVMPYTDTTTTGGQLWYKATYQAQTIWVLGTCVKIMTQAEYQQYIGVVTPTTAPTAVPDPSLMSDKALTTIANLLIRKTASQSGSSLLKMYTLGTLVTVTGKTTTAEGYTWVEATNSGVTGWVRGDYLRILTKTEAALYAQTGNPDAPKEASYRTLRKGMSGSDVTAMQTELYKQGYLAANEIDGEYLTITVNAVIKYQRNNGLVVDGIAGPNTLHALFGTVPVGTGSLINGSSVAVTLNPVEKIDWYTGGIQSIYARGTTAIITDVKTNISFRARRWAGGRHADVEPLTAADTAAMCRIYGVKTAQAISDGNMYQRRPIWVTIGNRTFCASMYGIPHNYPDGDTIDDNEFNGQFCVHFVNSEVHESQKVDANHMAAIQYAYDHAAQRK